MLRESVSNLSRADLVILTKTNTHQPSDYLINIIENVKCPTINNKIELDDMLINIKRESYALDIINSKNVYLFSALGDHEGFEKIMENTGAIIVGHDKYPDHYIYTPGDLKNIEENANKNGANFLITTEKDIIKIKDYNSKVRLYAVRMKMVYEPEGLLNKYIEYVV
jgi:tetraacyldisaccharide 4'-kinase